MLDIVDRSVAFGCHRRRSLHVGQRPHIHQLPELSLNGTTSTRRERDYHHSGDEREGTAPQSGTSVHVAERNHPPPFHESSMSGKVRARRDANGNSVVNYSWFPRDPA